MSDKYLKSGRKYAVAFNLMSEVGCTLRTLTDYSFTQVIGSVGGAYSTNGVYFIDVTTDAQLLKLLYLMSQRLTKVY